MKLGIDSVAYLNMAAAGAGWTTPTWEEMDFISDLTEKSDWDNAEIIIRRSWVKQGAKTVIDCGVSCKMLREPGNPLYAKILNALRTRDTVDVLILDASIDTVGAEGIRYIAQVQKGGGSQNPTEALWREIDFVPFPDADPTHVPSWADVNVAGTAVFTPITDRTGATVLGAMGDDQLAREDLGDQVEGGVELGGDDDPTRRGKRRQARAEAEAAATGGGGSPGPGHH